MTIEVYLLNARDTTIETRCVRRVQLLDDLKRLVGANETSFVQTPSGHMVIVDKDLPTELLTRVATFDGLAIPASRNIVIAGIASTKIVSPRVSLKNLASMIDVIFPIVKPSGRKDERGAAQFDILTRSCKPKVSLPVMLAKQC